MRRRDKAVKTRRHRRRAEPKAARRNSVAAGKETNVARLTRELKEAREQQTGTFKVLQVISSSPGELEPVFRAILENATRICGAKFGVLWRRFDDGTARIFASLSVPSAFAEFLQRGPHRPGPFSPINRVAKTRQRVHIADFRVDQAYLTHDPLAVAGVELGGQRTLLVVPMLKEDKLVGMIAIYRQEVRPFTDKQIELVENFAAQAVIAIENARLLNELRESLQQQTATSEVLSVISSSPGELEPVFQAMLENALRICEAEFGVLNRCEGDAFRAVAMHGAPQPYVEERRKNPIIRPPPATALGRALATKQPVQIADVLNEPHYFDAPSGYSAVLLTKLSGARTVLAVPMLKENELIGAIVIYRTEVRPFTDKQIDLVKNFAAQAVIAIENTRLLSALRQRTDDLSEALEQQTATSEVLKVISSSPGELGPVFQAMLERAVRICEAKFGNLLLVEGDAFRHLALHGAPQAYLEKRRREPVIRARPGSDLDRVRRTKQIVQVADMKMEDAATPAIIELAGARTVLAVPMLKENELIGAIVIYRTEVRPFSDKQIELVKNFAAQAVIAIENARLLNELRQSLEQQTATADVLKVISSSPGDLEPVFQSMLVKAVQICEAKFGVLFRCYHDSEFYAVAWVGVTPEYEVSLRERQSFRPDADAPLGRLLLTKELVHTADELAEKSASPAAKYGGARSLIAVPMRKHNELVGALVIYRTEVRPFTEEQIELVRNFAAQAVIAIENARLLNELRQRTDDLSESLEQQTATSEVLKVISSIPGKLEPVFTVMLDNAVRICEAKFGALFLFEGDAWRAVALHSAAPPLFIEARRRHPVLPITPGTALGRVTATKQVVQIADVRAEPAYLFDSSVKLGVETGDFRTVLSVPMLKEGELVGAFNLFHQEVRQFTDKQIELVKNFAAQAVIAIENTRLLNDLNKLNQQLEQRVTDQVSEIERIGRLRRFLPPQVADLIVASGTEKQLESHRREITALFCDLRGFTGFSESSDPEDVMALLREYHAAIGGIINKYGGTLERYAGDGVMVVFNDPIPVDNPAIQAVRMAIDMRAAIGELTEKWRKLGHDIGFGIGIAHGFATLGTIGFEGRFDYAAIGTVSNVASRLCDEATPGQILISPRVLIAVEKDITVEPVGDFSLKGIRRPLTAYNVLATKATN